MNESGTTASQSAGPAVHGAAGSAALPHSTREQGVNREQDQFAVPQQGSSGSKDLSVWLAAEREILEFGS